MAYSNSPLASYTRLTSHRNSPRNHAIDRITIHCMAGQMTGKACADYFATTSRKVSSNYCVGYDGDIALSVEEKNRSWCSSSSSNDHRAITIEVATDSTYPYKCTDKAYAALLDLVTDICKRNGIKKLNYTGDTNGNMTKHKWFAATACPGAYLEGKFPEIQNEVNKRLSDSESSSKPAENKNLLTYPVKVMNITQGYSGNYSHGTHSTGSPADYPIDEACSDSGRDWFYCPCDEMRIAHIYGVGKIGTNTIWLESTDKVKMPVGEDFVTILVTHPNDDDLKKLTVGQIFMRGQAMFREGNDGNATGYHFHIAVGTGKFKGNGWVKNSKGAWVNQTTGRQLKPEEAFYVDTSFTKVKNSSGVKFVETKADSSEKKMYFVQTGAFTKITYAQAMVKKLQSLGYSAFIKTEGDVYRVQTGAFSNKKNAEAQAAKLKAQGFSAIIKEQPSE